MQSKTGSAYRSREPIQLVLFADEHPSLDPMEQLIWGITGERRLAIDGQKLRSFLLGLNFIVEN